MAMNMFTGPLDGGVLEHLPDSIDQIKIGTLRVGVELGVKDMKCFLIITCNMYGTTSEAKVLHYDRDEKANGIDARELTP
jgi:hypothetical protein